MIMDGIVIQVEDVVTNLLKYATLQGLGEEVT
jgi:hypothetical protein